jgi:hypothetical protein
MSQPEAESAIASGFGEFYVEPEPKRRSAKVAEKPAKNPKNK